MTFAAGQSGNPGGRPKGMAEVRELARKHTKAAIKLLADMVQKGQSEQARILAANSLLDRGWGKPTQPIAGDDDAPPIQVTDAYAILLAELARAADAGTESGGDGEAEPGAG